MQPNSNPVTNYGEVVDTCTDKTNIEQKKTLQSMESHISMWMLYKTKMLSIHVHVTGMLHVGTCLCKLLTIN